MVRNGFRRSGQFTYRPWCDTCRACIPVRLPVDRLQTSRTQRKILRRQAGMEVSLLPLAFHEAHYALYRRYQASRHPGGGMDDDSREQYEQFILRSQVDSLLVEFRSAGALKMVSLIDHLNDGLSSVYTFFEPDDRSASHGTYNILWQASFARQIGLPYLYLGYLVHACRKMAYKARFKPIEGLVDGVWVELPPTPGEENEA